MRFLTRLENWIQQNQFAWNEIRPHKNWIRLLRQERGLLGKELAQRMDLSAARISVIEKEESNGSLTLKMMQRAAHALDCEFVYVLIPKAALKVGDEKEKPKLRIKASSIVD